MLVFNHGKLLLLLADNSSGRKKHLIFEGSILIHLYTANRMFQTCTLLVVKRVLYRQEEASNRTLTKP